MPPLLVSLTPLPAATWFSQEVSHSSTDQAQPCLASVGNQSWAAGWYGCSIIFCTYVSPFVLDFFCSVTLVLSYINCLKRWPWRQNVMSPPTINLTKQSQKSGKHAVRSQTIKGISISVKINSGSWKQKFKSEAGQSDLNKKLKTDLEMWHRKVNDLQGCTSESNLQHVPEPSPLCSPSFYFLLSDKYKIPIYVCYVNTYDHRHIIRT